MQTPTTTDWMKSAPLISVIIPALNEADTLRTTIDSIRQAESQQRSFWLMEGAPTTPPESPRAAALVLYPAVSHSVRTK